MPADTPPEQSGDADEEEELQTARWQTVLQLRYPAATVASDLTMPYKRGDTTKVLPDPLVALLRTHDEEKARADEAEVGRAAAEEGRAAEKRRADEEKARANAAEREVVRLKALFDKAGE